jgi:hypothetical protein
MGSLLFFLVGRGSELRTLHCKAGAPLFESHPWLILLWLFWNWGLVNYLLGLASNLHPPNLSLKSSWDYRHEHGCLAPDTFLNIKLSCVDVGWCSKLSPWFRPLGLSSVTALLPLLFASCADMINASCMSRFMSASHHITKKEP